MFFINKDITYKYSDNNKYLIVLLKLIDTIYITEPKLIQN